jgi:hypothetical protein
MTVGVYACLPVVVLPGQQQEQNQTQSQSQVQVQSVNQNVAVTVPKDLRVLGVGDAETYSRLVYPEEVLTFPIQNGGGCSVISAYPVGLYTITALHGYGIDMVQTIEAQPVYDPIRHKMEFGHVPVVDKIDYWTMKAFLYNTKGDYCVLDNRAPGNDFNSVELTVFKMSGV